MSIFSTREYAKALGIHADSTCSPVSKNNILAGEGSMDERTFLNLTNIAGWIPGLGIITGIAKWIHANAVSDANYNKEGVIKKQDPMVEKYADSLRARGTAEILCCGPILFLVDMTATIGRILSRKCQF